MKANFIIKVMFIHKTLNLVFIQSWCKPSTDMELLKSWILYDYPNPCFKTVKLTSEYIFEIFEIFEVRVRIGSDMPFIPWDFSKSRILNIRKVRIGSNIKCFEVFGHLVLSPSLKSAYPEMLSEQKGSCQK